MEAEARYTFVGAGVLLLLAALVAGVVWLKNVGGKGDFNRYTINFEQQALDGLEVGADVTLRGIKVGRVEDYALVGDILNRVRVEVRVDSRAPVRQNTVAVITRNFVTGIAAVTLITREPAGDALTEAPEGERYPVIGEGRSDLEEIAGRVNKVGEMAAVALNNLNQILDADNRAAVTDTLRNLRDLSASLNQRVGMLDQTLQRVGNAAGDIGKAAAELGRTGDRIASVAEGGAARFERTMGEVDLALADARLAMKSVAKATDSIQLQTASTARRLEETATNVDDQLGVALSELRLSIESATRVLDRLKEPRAALLGPGKAQLGPGETLP